MRTTKKEYTARESYRNIKKASSYDEIRYKGIHGRLKNWTKKRAIGKGLSYIGPIESILDIPCGTGRFYSFLSRKGYSIFGADISHEMMMVSKNKNRSYSNHHGYVQCDAEHIPFRDDSIDCILSIRFMFHLPPDVRKRVLSEMYRITGRWVIVDFRHSTFKTSARKIGAFLGLSREKKRSTLLEIRQELAGLGFKVHKSIQVVPVFSEKVVFVCEKVVNNG
jgi:ubiquinone/menaquinone biosynthesis C-methylase UbiE